MMNCKQTTPRTESAPKAFSPWCASCALKQKDRIIGGFETLSDVDKRIELCFLEKQLKAVEKEFDEKARIFLEQTEPGWESGEATDTVCTVDELAEKLRKQGVDIGRNQLFKWLRNNGYARYGNGRAYQNLPTQESLEKNYMITVQIPHLEKRTGKIVHRPRIRVTPLGQEFFGRALRAEYGAASKAVRV